MNSNGCFADATDCEGFCLRAERCIWYAWSVIMKPPFGLVYRNARSKIESDLLEHEEDSVTTKTVSPYEGFQSSGIEMTGCNDGRCTCCTYIMESEGVFYHVDTSPSSSPQADRAGDI